MTAENDTITISPEVERDLEVLLTRYPPEHKEAALLPVLHRLQDEFNWLPRPAVDYAADLLGVSRAKAWGVATFYTMYRKEPVGKYLLQVCTNISCSLLGAAHIVEHIQSRLGIGVGDTTPDGRFTLIEVECLGSCGTAPVMQINNDYYESLTPERVDEILDSLE